MLVPIIANTLIIHLLFFYNLGLIGGRLSYYSLYRFDAFNFSIVVSVRLRLLLELGICLLFFYTKSSDLGTNYL
jgi:hypothetical protein